MDNNINDFIDEDVNMEDPDWEEKLEKKLWEEQLIREYNYKHSHRWERI